MNLMQVTVIDYGIGNLYSVSRALKHCGAEVIVSSDPSAIAAAQRLVLPGVGAFANGMQGLRERGLAEPIRRFAASDRPLLGICLGMQMLATISEEFGEHAGLDLIRGRVVRVPPVNVDGNPQKIPHIGWADLVPSTPGRWTGTIFEGTPKNTSVYLVHSFYFLPDDPVHRIADCFYGGHRITAAVQSRSMIGCQFHPEKSSEAGLRLLAAFLAL